MSEVPTLPTSWTDNEGAGRIKVGKAEHKRSASNFPILAICEGPKKNNKNGTTSVEPEKYYDGPSGDGVDKFDIRQTPTGGYKYILVIWAKSPWAK